MSLRLSGYDIGDAIGYHYGKFPPKNLDYARLIGPLGRAAAALARYDAVLDGLHNKELLLAPVRRQEAVISSRIEGTIATLDEVLKFEAEDGFGDTDGPRRSLFRLEIIEVHSYMRALNHAQNLLNQGLPICGRVIREAHQRMLFLGRGADKQPGVFKTEQNYVVDNKNKSILFTPISPEELGDGFENLEDYINEADIDPLIQTALSHIEFEALHPFKDGNGRIGRILITLMLWYKGLISGTYFYISGQLEERREEYISRMRYVSSHDEWTEWCIFFLEALETQATENLKIARKISDLYEDMKFRFQDALASQWSIRALDFIFSRPVFRNNTFTSQSGIPKPTAARFTKILLQRGLLKTVEPPAGRRPGVYAFEPLLEIVRS